MTTFTKDFDDEEADDDDDYNRGYICTA